jgi:ABC-type antimicrobial peptide transport system permease subunit
MISSNSAQPRWHALLVGAFAGLALLLGTLGIYGVLAYPVELRAREIGARIALGATSQRHERLVVGEGLTVAGLGTVAAVCSARARPACR